ncbi:hypothetical protein MYXO_03406 [Myxococcaceae bacterium]|nr:hypothetical protein MYXO_03406 [Myxococcaceae bacterium]
MDDRDTIFVGRGEHEARLLARFANRHGLVAGATGTGKTVTLQVLSEGFSRLGVPVFVADVKGDLAGISRPGEAKPKLVERAREVGVAFEPRATPVVFWDLFGEQGHPLRTTISEMGPLLLARLLDLNDVQEGVLNVAFRAADDEGLLLLDLDDLRSMLAYVAENSKAFAVRYGAVASSSVGAIQRALLVLEQQGATRFFGEPSLEIGDLLRLDDEGRGFVHVLAADTLVQRPKLYASFLLWLLSELFEELPEVGDPEKPRLVFFFDEAHLLFHDAPQALIDRIEQVVRLIRSKGVGVYFVTHAPRDVPDRVLGQLGNRVQHALRAFTPRDQKAVRAAAETFRANPSIDVAREITELGIGEALVSFLGGDGAPSVVERVKVRPPASRLGPVSAAERTETLSRSPVGPTYDRAIDRESAHEMLAARAEAATRSSRATDEDAVDTDAGSTGRSRPSRSSRTRESAGEALMKSAARSLGTQIGRQIIRSILGSIRRG